jgi:hypothetical protein
MNGQDLKWKIGICYHPFLLTGQWQTEFFLMLKRLGAKFIWNHESEMNAKYIIAT